MWCSFLNSSYVLRCDQQPDGNNIDRSLGSMEHNGECVRALARKLTVSRVLLRARLGDAPDGKSREVRRQL